MRILFLLFITLLLLSSCTINRKIKDGDTAFERKQYALAVDLLQNEYEESRFRDVRASRAFMIALAYERMNRDTESLTWYRTSYEDGYGSEALIAYANTLRKEQQYNNAVTAYQKLIDDYGTNEEWERALQSCAAAQIWIEEQESSPYRIQNWSANTPSSDYAPTFYEDGRVIFTSDRGESTGDKTYMWTGNDFMDLFIASTSGLQVASFSEKFNTQGNEGTIAFDKEFSQAYFSRCNSEDATDAFCQLYFSRKEGDHWTVPEPLPFLKEGVNYGHPAVSDDGTMIIYSAKDPDGLGGYDLYVTYRRGSGWIEPSLLPEGINTTGNEMFPSMNKDTLYFSSDHHMGMGGLDVFKTYHIIADSWAPPVNMKPPVNSGADDFAFVVDPFYSPSGDVLQRGFYTSARKGGKGNDDIFRFEKIKPVEEEPTEGEIMYTIRVKGQILEHMFEQPDNPNSRKIGTAPLAGSSLEVLHEDGKLFPEVDPYGRFVMELDFDRKYTFLASRDGYLSNDYTLDTRSVTRDPEHPETTFLVDILLDRIFLNTEIVLENIYYDYDKWDIRPDAEPVLLELADLMFKNPSIRIELGSHTDCRGEDQYNMKLSQKRAQSAVDFLISSGVGRGRMRPVGYGESRLTIQCECEDCNEVQHQVNRRTTFKIVQ